MLDFILGSAMNANAYGGYGYFEPQSSSAGRSDLAPQRGTTIQLEAQMDELRLVCAALWSLLKKKTQCTDDELVVAISEADLRDGVKDGKITPVKQMCPKCGKQLVTRKRDVCSWCGQPTGLPPI